VHQLQTFLSAHINCSLVGICPAGYGSDRVRRRARGDSNLSSSSGPGPGSQLATAAEAAVGWLSNAAVQAAQAAQAALPRPQDCTAAVCVSLPGNFNLCRTADFHVHCLCSAGFIPHMLISVFSDRRIPCMCDVDVLTCQMLIWVDWGLSLLETASAALRRALPSVLPC